MVNFGVQNDQNEHGCFVLLRLFDPRGGPDRVPHSDPYFKMILKKKLILGEKKSSLKQERLPVKQMEQLSQLVVRL